MSKSKSKSEPTIDLGFLVDQGKELPSLLRKAKKGHEEVNADIQGKVKNVVTTVLESIKSAREEGTYFPRESMENLLKKINTSLEEFIRSDPEYRSGYDDLIKKVEKFEYEKPISANWSSFIVDTMQFTHSSDEPVIDLSAMKELNDHEYRRLCCFLLFPAKTDIMKRDIVHCWIAMDNMDHSLANDLLAKFVTMGLIEQTVHKKKQLGIYKMPPSVHSFISHQQTNLPTLNGNWRSWSTLCKTISSNGKKSQTKKKTFLQRIISSIKRSFKNKKPEIEVCFSTNPTENDQPSTLNPVITVDLEGHRHEYAVESDFSNTLPKIINLKKRETICPTEMLLNINQTPLDAEQFKKIAKMKRVKVVHLGSWYLHSKKYIVVKDARSFRYLRHLSDVRFLSLAGLSGISTLPKYIYRLKTLRVLDLRACNDLEILPSGIESLEWLTHLDLSGCHLLDHVPSGITSLTNLQVLKGFIVNTDEIEQSNSKESSSSCLFGELSKLNQLSKLSVITRKLNFPTNKDLETFYEMEKLSCLKITWIGNSTKTVVIEGDVPTRAFPSTLKKLELQAAPNEIASRVLGLISNDMGNNGLKSLEKLYIRGGGLTKLIDYSFPRPKVVRLLYLPDLDINWDDFKKMFPNMERLEVLHCPMLTSFPCFDSGLWVK